MKTLPVLPLLLALALAACGKPGDKPVQAPVAPATEANLPADAAEGAPAYSASDAGIGPVTTTTPFTQDAIAALFPGSQVKEAFLNEEGMQTSIVTVNGPDELVLEIQQSMTEGRVGKILAQGGPVAGPKGETLLDRWSALGFARDQCVMGVDRFVNALLCRRPGAPNLAYVLAIPGYQATDDQVPPEALLADKAFLREFLWQGPLSN
jgi:hypothetical protein